LTAESQVVLLHLVEEVSAKKKPEERSTSSGFRVPTGPRLGTGAAGVGKRDDVLRYNLRTTSATLQVLT
jgi:hypothetical protein